MKDAALLCKDELIEDSCVSVVLRSELTGTTPFVSGKQFSTMAALHDEDKSTTKSVFLLPRASTNVWGYQELYSYKKIKKKKELKPI